MEKRTITGLLASAYVIAMVLLGKTALLINIALLLVVGTYEVLQSLSAGGFHPVKWVYYPYVLLLVPAYLWGGDRGLLLMLMIGAMTAMAASSSMDCMPSPDASTAADMAPAILLIVSPWSASPKRASMSLSSCSAAVTAAQAFMSLRANSSLVTACASCCYVSNLSLSHGVTSVNTQSQNPYNEQTWRAVFGVKAQKTASREL